MLGNAVEEEDAILGNAVEEEDEIGADTADAAAVEEDDAAPSRQGLARRRQGTSSDCAATAILGSRD